MPDPAAPVPPRCFDTPCPVFPRPGQSRPLLQSSVWTQVDGYLYAYLGVRLERDLYAVSPATSACVAFGLPGQHIPAGAFDGLYFTSPADMPAVVAAVASWHGRGAFVVPEFPSTEISDLISRALLSSKAVGRAKRVEGRMPWMDFLRAHTHLTISIPGGLLVLYASFNSPAKFKKWPSGRPRAMTVVDVPLLRKYGHILPVPIVVTVATDRQQRPPASLDVAPVASPLPFDPTVVLPKPLTTWNVSLLLSPTPWSAAWLWMRREDPWTFALAGEPTYLPAMATLARLGARRAFSWSTSRKRSSLAGCAAPSRPCLSQRLEFVA